MRIGLLTFHDAINYGAALQVYASQRALNQMGFDCEVINYVNPTRRDAYNMLAHAKKNLKEKKVIAASKYVVGSAFMRRRRKNFKKFYSKNLSVTKEVYRNSSEAQILNRVYDKFIVGSDQVWNYENNGSDYTYLLNFVQDNKKKISYSSSFGLAQIPSEYKESYVDLLSKINHLSTREEYGVELIKTLTDRKAELVLDPVFLLNKEEWLKLSSNKAHKKPYVFSYTNRGGQWEEFLEKTSYSMKNKKVHKISRHLTVKDFLDNDVEVAYSISPNEFINQIANANLVVSASFHCIALSIILNTPFVAILTGDKGKDERVMNILRITGLESRVLSNEIQGERLDEINFENVEKRLNKHIELSKKFLKDAVKN